MESKLGRTNWRGADSGRREPAIQRQTPLAISQPAVREIEQSFARVNERELPIESLKALKTSLDNITEHFITDVIVVLKCTLPICNSGVLNCFYFNLCDAFSFV